MNRLFKSGIVTTIIGVVIVGAAVFTFTTGKVTSAEAVGMGSFGLIFLRSKDSLIGLKPKDETHKQSNIEKR